MRRSFLAIQLGILFWQFSLLQCHNAAFGQMTNESESFDDAMLRFKGGDAHTGEEFFFGVQSYVVKIDVKLRAVEFLDSIDARPEKFQLHFDAMLSLIRECKSAMKQYGANRWPKQAQLQALTVEWVDAVQVLIQKYLRKLAVPLSIPDKDWKESYFKLYDKYILEYEKYLETDGRWVDFQYEFAAANGFQLSDETIDMEPLIQEDLSE